ncbi:molybdopterin-dependent oxidoreductase [Salipiger abyssi]|uniref:molybdopterin-dependent oxidoreductase n=1 Tax=Salipiger abyssi TaxID=1250539 RepID=UPI004058068B
MTQTLKLRTILSALPGAVRLAARLLDPVKAHLQTGNHTVQLRLRDGSLSRHITFRNGKITAGWGRHPAPDAEIVFMDSATALKMLQPKTDYAFLIDALKNFKITQTGDDAVLLWFGQLVDTINTASMKRGTRMPDGTMRYTNLTNGGPLFVYVKDGKILRTTPIDLAEDDAESWTLTARGRSFTPRRQATLSPHALGMKSQVYSDKRILYPMKRVDWDPNGERNPQNRGKSGYERISWDEAFDLVASEIRRMKTEYGPGAIAAAPPAHHQWGNLNYWLSALLRFSNLIGATRVEFSPISWEGWYWGATHHFGNSIRLGLPGFYGTVQDCLDHAEQIVFWGSDPETTNGIYAGFEGTERRLWAKELGIEFIHIDPHKTATAQLLGGTWVPVRPGTDAALAIAIMHEWMVTGSYDKDYVASRTTGFDEWEAYVLGREDGVPKTPEWQEEETGVPAHVARALARQWAGKKTYLAAGGLGAGFGGPCRGGGGAQWARAMVMLMAMQGWGKPGINFGNLQMGAPQDYNFYFPGYADGGISGDVVNSASVMHNYVRMPHIVTINPVKQAIPRQRLADAIVTGKAEGYYWDGFSAEGQFVKMEYPRPGFSPVHMYYRYGASSLGTVPGSNRMVEAYRHESLETVVTQAIWMENEAKFADIILPACTSFERDDISESANCAGYIHHNQSQLNHRVIVMQHKAIEPLGESKSDYQIFAGILTRLGMGAMFTEGGCSDLTWCKRIFESTDLADKISWKAFLKKGYYIVPTPADHAQQEVDMRWFAEGRTKNLPEPNPLPAVYSQGFGQGLGTQSGKFEFVPGSLKRLGDLDPARPAVNRYMRPPDTTTRAADSPWPLQLITAHPRYSFHTQSDGKNSAVNEIADHRVLVDGHRYWIVRMNPEDAAERGVADGELVKVHNDRGAVLCAARVTPLMARGVIGSWESCAEYDPVDTPDGPVDRGGCLNLLTPARTMSRMADGITPNSCLIQITRWADVNATEEAAA